MKNKVSKVFYGLAIAFLLFGIVGTIVDLKDTKKLAKKYSSIRVIDASSVEEYKSLDEENTVFVTGIKLTGDKVTDPKKYIDGEYYLIYAEAQYYRLNYDDDGKEESNNSPGNPNCWGREPKYDFEVKAENTKTNIGDGTLISHSMIFGLKVSQYGYPKDLNSYVEGDLRYEYRTVDDSTEFTALVKIGKGKVELTRIYDSREYILIAGNMQNVNDYIDDFIVGDSYAILIVGIILAIIFGFLGIVTWRDKDEQKG